MKNLLDKYTVDVDLTKDDDALCDGLPWDVIIRFASVDWTTQSARRRAKGNAVLKHMEELGLTKSLN